MTNQDLLQELERADLEARGITRCSVCQLVEDQSRDLATREALRAAASAESKIGLNKLAKIFRQHELGAGVRAIRRHRQERHLL